MTYSGGSLQLELDSLSTKTHVKRRTYNRSGSIYSRATLQCMQKFSTCTSTAVLILFWCSVVAHVHTSRYPSALHWSGGPGGDHRPMFYKMKVFVCANIYEKPQ
jgi:hypothetical protein